MPAVAIEHADLLRVPFLKHGRTRQGMDCLGVVLALYNRAGLYLPDAHAVGKDAACRSLERIEEPRRPLDIVYIAKDGEERCLVLLDRERALGASPERGVYVESVARIRRVSERLPMEFWRHPGSGYLFP
jgi:hypothetical protein